MYAFRFFQPSIAVLFSIGVSLGCAGAHAGTDNNGANPETNQVALSAHDIAEQYGADASRDMVTISPDGKAIALYSRSERGDFVLVHSLENNELITGVDVSDLKPRSLYFISEQHLIMVASQEKRMRGLTVSSLDISTAYALDLKSGEIMQLLRPGDVIWKAQTGLGRIVGLSRDKKTLYMPAYAATGGNGINPDLALLAVDIEDPSRPRILDAGHAHTHDYFVDPDGNVIAEIRVDREENRTYVLAPEGDQWQTVYSEHAPETVAYFLGTSPDREHLIMIRENKETGVDELLRLTLKDGSLQPLRLGRNAVDFEQLITRIDRTAIGARFSGFHPRYHLFDGEVSDRLTSLQAKLDGHSVYLASLSADHKHMVVKVEGSSTSGDYYLAADKEPLRYLTSSRPAVPDESVNPVVQLEYESRDGMTIPTLLTLPRNKAEKPRNLPMVIYPHGGPQSYDRIRYDGFVQAMAARGYAVVQPQFRGSTGFGLKHWKAGQGEWGRGMQDDLTDAVNYLTQAGLADPERVCIVGGSYGGYAALAGATFTPDLYRCAVSINGVTDLTRMMEHDEEKFEDSDWVYDYLTRSVAKDFFTPERIAAYSPANFAEGVKAPVLLIHGEDDSRVPIEQSEVMSERLREAGKLVELVRLKDTGHSLWKEEKRVKAMTRLLEFLDQHLAKES